MDGNVAILKELKSDIIRQKWFNDKSECGYKEIMLYFVMKIFWTLAS